VEELFFPSLSSRLFPPRFSGARAREILSWFWRKNEKKKHLQIFFPLIRHTLLLSNLWKYLYKCNTRDDLEKDQTWQRIRSEVIRARARAPTLCVCVCKGVSRQLNTGRPYENYHFFYVNRTYANCSDLRLPNRCFHHLLSSFKCQFFSLLHFFISCYKQKIFRGLISRS